MKRIDKMTWEIPKTFKQGMRVNARVIGTEDIVNNMDLAVYDQITNVATLPGIIEPAYVMPDGHSGYGFPIGGVAAIDVSDEKGVISPGGIGFDINCLAGTTKVLLEHGYTKTIAQLQDEWQDETVKVMNLTKKDLERSRMVYFLKKRPDCPVLKMETAAGHSIVGTSDHPIQTVNGMVPLGEIKPGSKVAIFPFEGVPHENPPEEVILTEDDILALDLPDINPNDIIKELHEKRLLPLSYRSSRLPLILKIFGYLLGGGGTIHSLPLDTPPQAWFHGELEDLVLIQKDLQKLGWTSTEIHSRNKILELEIDDRTTKIEVTDHVLQVKSKSLVALLVALGLPLGNKTSQHFLIPPWVMKSPKWMKRLFLAACLGAVMNGPTTITNHGHEFKAPTIEITKLTPFETTGRQFLEQLRTMFKEFDIETFEIIPVSNFMTQNNDSGIKQAVQLKLTIKPTKENLINLYSRVGYEYNKRKQFLGLMAVQYLLLLKRTLKLRNESTELTPINSERRFSSMTVLNFPSFDQFIDLYGVRDKNDSNTLGWAWDTVVSIEVLEDFNEEVYDFTVAHDDHNFIANGIIVSNCGMRLVTTNLEEKDVKPRLKEVVDLLFERVPAGVGSRGFVHLTPSEFKEVVELGAKWCIEHGYGWEEDLERTELFGCMEGADSSKISKKAIQRGLNQVGTLGSGNHYLEVQVIKEENIFDQELAKKFGLFPNQVVIMFHCGSRGFGHQVATDYLQLFLSVMERKYGIKILDRELACAPFNSTEGQDYYAAMKCGVNMSFANRQTILHRIREVFSKVFKAEAEDLGLKLIYDVSHNRASIHKQRIDGEMKEILVHRKGATAAFGPGREEIPPIWRDVGQPVIIGGSMETGSYLLVGTKDAEKTYYTTAHGSGRTMSRTKARKIVRGEKLLRDLEKRGIYVRSVSYSGAAEEAGIAYKDIHKVCEASELAGISKRVVSLVPIGNVKG